MTESTPLIAQHLCGTAPSPEVAVIVPYFQKKPGILARSIRSVFQQSGGPPVRVIVVDDGSPAAVESELAGLDPKTRERITLIRQKNQGPGPARNTGLDAVTNTTDYIAFLDSDDTWHEHHLSRAISMMEKGFDFYFADGDMEGGQFGLFQAVKFDSSAHPYVAEDKSLLEFTGNFLSLLLDASPIVTSTVLIRKSKLGQIRFPPLKGTCEDLLYWLDIALEGPRVGFSRTIEATGGTEGLHVSHRGDWKSNKSLRMIYDFDQYYRRVLRRIPLSRAQRDRIVQRSSSNRLDFLAAAAAMVKAGRLPSMRLIWDFLVANPGIMRDVIVRVNRFANPVKESKRNRLD